MATQHIDLLGKNALKDKIKAQLAENRIVLYMKGVPDFPQCGFSSRVVHLLRECGAEFKAVNILDDDALREGIKQFGSWPTIPQLYIEGKLIGGSDILVELKRTGELEALIVGDSDEAT